MELLKCDEKVARQNPN